MIDSMWNTDYGLESVVVWGIFNLRLTHVNVDTLLEFRFCNASGLGKITLQRIKYKEFILIYFQCLLFYIYISERNTG